MPAIGTEGAFACLCLIAGKPAPTSIALACDPAQSTGQSSLMVMLGIAGAAASCNTMRAPT
ncbi:hypothetical protein KU43P_42030 [Pseudomonas sp. KU43P]|nr:hypothetical protein KU43P_42030 [Pseudomonas sp. KU43P]